jgi:hypothetical protein
MMIETIDWSRWSESRVMITFNGGVLQADLAVQAGAEEE